MFESSNINFNKLNIIIKIVFIIFFFFSFLNKGSKTYNNMNKLNNNYIPKITIFVPIYNKAKYLKRSISSIQRQTLKDIEIILVNDCSTDDSFKIINEFAQKDERIKIINNTKNSGLLFSRAMGIINSKGEYLMDLDPDDQLLGKNNLDYLYNTAKKLNVDFITFFIFFLPNRIKSGQYFEFNIIVKQPELFKSAFKDNILKDFYITNKLVKREILIKAFNAFKNEIYGEKWNYHEDNIWSILIYKYSNSSVFVDKNVYCYYSKNIDSEMYNRGNVLELKNLIYKNEMIKKILNNKEEEQYVINEHLVHLKIFEEHINLIRQNKEIKDKIINDLKGLMTNCTLTNEFRNRIFKLINNIKN